MADTIRVNIDTSSQGSTDYKNLAELTHDIEVLESRINEIGNTPVHEIDTNSSILDFGRCYICTTQPQNWAFTLNNPVDENSVSSCIIYLHPNNNFDGVTFAIDDDKIFLSDVNCDIVAGKWNKIVITSAKDYYSMVVENYKIV